MKKKLLFMIIGLSLLVIACQKEDTIQRDGVENVPGTYYRSLTTNDGQEREFIVYVPTAAAGKQNVPVLFVIHGTNQTGQVHYDKNLWNPKADQEGFIVVYPTALVYCHFDNGVERTTTKWAAGDLGETEVDKGALPLCQGEMLRDDMLFFDELVVTIKEGYMVDRSRIYITGFSNGAQMTARLAAQRSELFAAVTIHAGNLSQFIPSTLAARPMSMVVSVGATDGLFLNAIGRSERLPLNEEAIDDPGLMKVLSSILDISGLANQYTYTSTQMGGKKVANFLFESSTVGLDNSLRFVLIEDLGHSYTEILIDPFWAFLEGQSLP